MNCVYKPDDKTVIKFFLACGFSGLTSDEDCEIADYALEYAWEYLYEKITRANQKLFRLNKPFSKIN